MEKDDSEEEEEVEVQKGITVKRLKTGKALAHRVKNNMASFASNPLFKRYMPDEIQQLLEYFVYLLGAHSVGDKEAKKMKVTIVKALVELFVMFDDGLVPTTDFRDVYQLFRRVCSLCKNTYLRRQVNIVETQNKNMSLSMVNVKKLNEKDGGRGRGSGLSGSSNGMRGSPSPKTKEEKGKIGKEEKGKQEKGKDKDKKDKGKDKDKDKKSKGKKKIKDDEESSSSPSQKSPKKKHRSGSLEGGKELVDKAAVARIAELTQQLQKEVMTIVTPLKLKKVSVQDVQSIFDVIVKEEFIMACFKDEIIPKIVCILADFLENY